MLLHAHLVHQFDGTCTMITSLTITGASLSDIDSAWIQLAMAIPLVRMQLLRCKTEEKDELEFSYTVPEHGQHSLKEWKSRTYKPFRELSRHRLQEKAIEGRNELRPCGDNGHSDVAHLYASQDNIGIHLVFSFQHAVTDARGQWSVSRACAQTCGQ